MTFAHVFASVLCVLLAEGFSLGTPVQDQFSLDQLAAQADFVFKGTVISSLPDANPNAGDQRTSFKVVSVIKGSTPSTTCVLLHLDSLTQLCVDIDPIHYHFVTSKTYLVFAKNTDKPGVYRPLWEQPRTEGNQGIFLCADNKAALPNLKDEVWVELTGLLRHEMDADVLYAIKQLDQMSGKGWGAPARFDTTLDFERKPVVDAVCGFVASPDPKVAEAAIQTLGSNNPYMTQERALYWLATVGSGEITGLVKMNPKMENLGGELDDNYLVAVANSNMPESRRSLAIRALGLARKPEIGAEVVKWTTDPSGQVRAAATVVLADYPALATPERLGLSGADLDFNVRVATAQCIGFGQINAGVKFLATMLGDSNLEVRKAAAQSLLSFSPRDAEVASALKANLGSHDFGEVFMIALARIDPETYRDQLASSISAWSPTGPIHGTPWGGRVPCGDAQEILLKYLKDQPTEKLQGGRFDRYMDALDKAALNQLGSPLDVYLLYIRHGLTKRAQTLREAALKAFPYQQAMQYDQAFEHPDIYGQ